MTNDKLEDILKIVKSLEDSGIIAEEAIDMIKNDAKQQPGCFLSVLLDTLGASLLSNMLTGKGVIRAGKGTAKVDHGSRGFSTKNSSLKKF